MKEAIANFLDLPSGWFSRGATPVSIARLINMGLSRTELTISLASVVVAHTTHSHSRLHFKRVARTLESKYGTGRGLAMRLAPSSLVQSHSRRIMKLNLPNVVMQDAARLGRWHTW